MPIYEYVCQQCGENVEKLQKLSDAPLTDCPICGASALKRKVSAAGFRLSGGGWYETDFKSDGRRNLSGGDDSAKSKSSESSGSGSAASEGGNAGSGSGGDAAKNKPKTESKDSKPAKTSSGSADS